MTSMEVVHDFCPESTRNDRSVAKIYNATNREQRVSMLVVGEQIVWPGSLVVWCSSGDEGVEGLVGFTVQCSFL